MAVLRAVGEPAAAVLSAWEEVGQYKQVTTLSLTLTLVEIKHPRKQGIAYAPLIISKVADDIGSLVVCASEPAADGVQDEGTEMRREQQSRIHKVGEGVHRLDKVTRTSFLSFTERWSLVWTCGGQ